MKDIRRRIAKAETWVIRERNSFGSGDPGYGLASLLRLRGVPTKGASTASPGGLGQLVHRHAAKETRDANEERTS